MKLPEFDNDLTEKDTKTLKKEYNKLTVLGRLAAVCFACVLVAVGFSLYRIHPFVFYVGASLLGVLTLLVLYHVIIGLGKAARKRADAIAADMVMEDKEWEDEKKDT